MEVNTGETKKNCFKVYIYSQVYCLKKTSDRSELKTESIHHFHLFDYLGGPVPHFVHLGGFGLLVGVVQVHLECPIHG